jgi:predicted ArsR family transcriptional regulator
VLPEVCGCTLDDVAEVLGVSRQAVHYRLQQLEARQTARR